MTNPHSSRLALARHHKHLGIWLALIAGAMNAGGFLAVGTYTSHMTGITSSIADQLALDHIWFAAGALGLLIAFLAGASVTALLVNLMRDRKPGSEYATILLLEAVLVLLFGLCAALTGSPLGIFAFTALLCFSMGLQNALITKASSATIRTTHVTGLVTDIGIELGRALYKNWSRNTAMQTHPERLALFSWLLLAFIGGGMLGAFGFSAFGFICVIPPALILVVLAFTLARPS